MQPQAYLGTGVIGSVSSSRVGGRLVCRIDDYEAFREPVPFKVGDRYLERSAATYGPQAGLHFREGVRFISDEEFTEILALAEHDDADSGAGHPQASVSAYASPEVAKLVDSIAMEVALVLARSEYGIDAVRRMPHNNPGFDVEVTSERTSLRYIEVKGTTKPVPAFFMSEGERQFSSAHEHEYALWVVYRIDTDARAGRVIRRGGAVTVANAALEPTQWVGRLS